MKKSIHFLALILLLSVMFTTLVVPASAASNTANNDINDFTIWRTGYEEVNRDWKGNTTPVYLYITNIQNGVVGFYTRAVGYKDSTTKSGNPDLTLSNGSYTDYVLTFEEVEYSIRTMLYESGYTYAALGFNCSSIYTSIQIWSGYWSPDSSKVYTVATRNG